MIFNNRYYECAVIDDKKIIVKGIGRMFYQEGVPIGLLAKEAEKQGIKISWLHVADELQKHGWNKRTILSKLREEVLDSGEKFDFDFLERFLESSYEDQRQMIFCYLFKDEEIARDFLRELF